MGKFFVAAAIIGACAATAVQAEMRITTHDGRSFTVPVDARDVRSIDFSAAAADTQTAFDGKWKTTWGVMTLEQSGSEVSGTYDSDGGKIAGKVEGNALVGYWSENASSQRCDSPRDGRDYWGRIVFTASSDGSAFTGKWDYCQKDPAQSRQSEWAGKRM